MYKNVSIIIPTKDRYTTLFPVVRNIVANLAKTEYEIVISDNTYNNYEALSFLDSIDTNNIVYAHDPKPMSMVENAEKAIGLAKGEYYLLIGDDDFVSPYLTQIVNCISERKILSLTYPIANYYYSNVSFRKKYCFNNPSTLQITKGKKIEFKMVNTKTELKNVCEIGGIYINGLPRLYHGIVHHSLIEEIKNKYGKYIPGPCPDMTLSVCLAHLIDKHFFVNYPVSISGASSVSEGGKGPMNKHVVKIEEKKWLNPDDVKDWNANIPYIFSRETIWAQCVDHVNRISACDLKLNYKAIYSSMVINCPRIALQYVLPLYKSFLDNLGSNRIPIIIDFIKRYIKNFAFHLPSFIWTAMVHFRGDLNKYYCIPELTSINQCSDFIRKNYCI